MVRKFLPIAAATVLLAVPMTTPANAAKCFYAARNPFTLKVSSDITGFGRAIKQSNACNRAERECIRKLRKAWKKGKAQQFGCVLRSGPLVEWPG
jgi:hypothetical protein